jgi:hypothetical protein
MTHVLPHRLILKTDARFGAVVPLHPIGKAETSGDDDDFDWRSKKSISLVRNQGSCGSCWAVATTTAVADHFAVRGLTAEAPKLSYTRNMICFSDDPCNGGNPASLLKMASESATGFVEEACVDETSWCGAGGCSSQHFSSVFGKCGCMNDAMYKCFSVDRESVQWLVDDGANADFSDYVKTWIRKEGPLVAAFPVFKNFKPHLFEKNVYIESKTEKGDFDHSQALDHSEFLGFHAVVVIGWGVEHDVLTGPKRMQSVPYWLCRNSWGSQWNGDGHFKMPAYPFNTTVQFERPVTVADPQDNQLVHQAGGFVTFTVSKPPFEARIPKTIVVVGEHAWLRVVVYVVAVALVIAALAACVRRFRSR